MTIACLPHALATNMTKDLSITQYIQTDSIRQNIKSVLKERTSQFITSVISLVNSNEKLKEADKKSILNACLISASLNLPINQNLGYAYIIPYKDKDSGEIYAQFQIGYKGFIQLAMRSGQFKTLNATDVKEGELEGENRLTGELEFEWIEDEAERENTKTIGYIAYFRLLNGFEKSLYMTEDELKKHGLKFSKSFSRYKSGLWVDNFDSMAKKTVIKLLLSKFAPMNTEMAKAQLADQALIKGENEYEYIDNKPVNPEEEGIAKEKARILKYIEDSKTTEELEKCADAVKDFSDADLLEAYADKFEKLGGNK